MVERECHRGCEWVGLVARASVRVGVRVSMSGFQGGGPRTELKASELRYQRYMRITNY